jgi:hypothetical protein
MGIAVICSAVHKVFLTCTHASFYAHLIRRKIVIAVDDDDDIFLKQLMFTDEAMFHMNGHVNRNNFCIWGQKLPCEMYGHVQDFLKINVWCGIVHGAENTIMANIYLDMLHLFLFPQIAGIE